MEPKELDELVVIVNPSAGPARGRTVERVIAALSAEGARPRISVVPPADVPSVAREAARGGSLVGVAGGDGTLSGAAGAIAEAGGVLAPIPLGTRNHFSRRLGIDSLAAAARAVSLGHVALVPLGSVNGRIFINHASAGLYPRLVHHRERIRRWTGRPLAQLLAALYSVMRLRTMTLDLHVNDVTLERTVPGLWVALGRGAFRLPVDGHAPSGRNLEVLVPQTTSRLGLLAAGVRLFWRMRRGGAPDVSSVEVIHAPAFTLKALHAIDLSRDGEVERESSPIEFRIHPRALRVLSLVHAGDERWVA